MRRLTSFRLPALALGAVMTIAIATPPARATNVQEITSPSGITAWLVEDYTVPIVAMNVAFRGGAAQDPETEAGLANFMSATLDEGAGDLDSRAFQAKLEDLSINLHFDASPDALYGSLRTLTTNLDEAFDLFHLAVTEPRFDEEPVDRIRGQIIANLRRAESDPGQVARQYWATALFGDHPYGHTDGRHAGERRDDHARRPEGLPSAHRGARQPLRRDRRRDRSGDGRGGARPDIRRPPGARRPHPGQRHHAGLRPDGARRAQRAADHHPARRPGAEARRSRLHRRLMWPTRSWAAARSPRGSTRRSARSAASPIRSGPGLSPTTMPASSLPATSVDAANADTAVQIMLDEIARFAKEGPTEEELAAAKDYLIGNFALRFDSTQKIARNLLQLPARRSRHRLSSTAQRPDPRSDAGGRAARGAAPLGRTRRRL